MALNLEANLPTVLPENTNADLGVFLDFGNVWELITMAQLTKVIK